MSINRKTLRARIVELERNVDVLSKELLKADHDCVAARRDLAETQTHLANAIDQVARHQAANGKLVAELAGLRAAPTPLPPLQPLQPLPPLQPLQPLPPLPPLPPAEPIAEKIQA